MGPVHALKGSTAVTIDPSAIPNFGPQNGPEGQDQDQPSGPPPIVVPDQELVGQLLDQMQLKHFTDDEGDLTAPWDGFRVYYMFRGEQKELFSVRAFYDRAHPIEMKAELLEAIDEWNRDTLWPKVYTHTHDDGVVRLIGEAQLIVGMGVNLDFFVATTANWTQSAVQFEQWLINRLGLEGATAAEDGEPGGGDSADEA
jgi:hypothetical protein